MTFVLIRSSHWKKDCNTNKHIKFFPLPNARLSKRLLKFERLELKYLLEAITGHNHLRHFSNKISLRKQQDADYAIMILRLFLHLVNTCPKLATHRLEILNYTKFEGKNTKWNPVKLLEFLNLPQIKRMFSLN